MPNSNAPDRTDPVPRNPLEQDRSPGTPAQRGEQPSKRTNEERNDPEREPGARQGRDDAA